MSKKKRSQNPANSTKPTKPVQSSAKSSQPKKPEKIPQLSILVPVYNVERFLKLCLDSILNQSFSDFEVIIVDDGSTDNSPHILDEYQTQDKRLKVFHHENAGYGAALNFALKQSKGKYIGIVEPDDFIHVDMYKTLLEFAEKTSADIVKCSFYNYYGKTGKADPERVFHECSFKDPLIDPFHEQSIFLVDPSIWSCVYRRELIKANKIKFLETPGASFQDTGFQFKTFTAAKSIYCLEDPFYYYRRDNENSSVKSYDKVMNLKQEFDSIDEFSPFKEVSAACRFRAYIWNLNRLKATSALRFAKVMREDYERLKKTTPFRANFYVQHHLQRAHECKFAVKHPKLYTYFRPAFRLYNYLKHKMFMLLKKLHP